MMGRLWVIVPIGIALLTAAQIWVSHLRNEIALESQQLHSEEKAIAQSSSKLRLEVASLMRPERLRRYARQKLGMAPPTPMQVIHP